MAKHMQEMDATTQDDSTTLEPDEQRQVAVPRDLSSLEHAERAINSAFNTGKADRAKLTRQAQLDAAEAVALVGVAMEADEEADDAMRLSVIAEKNADRDGIRKAREREKAARRKARDEHRAASKAAKQAYDAIRFSAPNKLGLMRVMQAGFLFHIFMTLLLLWLTSRNEIKYDSGTIFDWVMIILEGVAFWFFVNQYKIAKPYVIGVGCIGIAYHVIQDIVLGRFSGVNFIGNILFYLLLIVYFLFSKRVDYVMVNDFSKHEGFVDNDDFVIERKGWPFYRNLVMYFVMFSVFGHWMEAGMCQFIILGWVEGEYDPTNTMLWRDWLYPFPMEGFAVVLIAVLLYPLFKWLQKKFQNKVVPYVVSFFANALACSVIEFSMGLLINADYQLWDYRENFGNIMGQVCLQNAVAFGVAASVIAWFVYPLMERWIARIRPEIVNIAFVVIAVFGGILWSLYIFDPPQGISNATNQVQEQRAADTSEADDNRRMIETGVEFGKASTDAIAEDVDKATYLSEADRAKIEEDIAEIQQRYDEIGEVLENAA